MKTFQFHAELFESRETVLHELDAVGVAWLSDFGSVDVLHDLYGLEVCAIREQSVALQILLVMRQLFPDWRHSRIFRDDESRLEPGWKVLVSRLRETYRDDWPPPG